MAKKPWRPIVVIEDENTGRFTRRQAQAAVRAVKERNEAKSKNRSRSVDGQSAEKPVKPESLPRKS